MAIELIGASEQQRARFEQARQVLENTPSGRPVVQHLDRAGTRVQIEQDGGHYLPGRNLVVLPEWVLEHPNLAATWLAHEGQHAIDDSRPDRSSVASLARAGMTGAVRGVLHLDNPFSTGMDALQAEKNRTETTAYEREATVARELGMNLVTNQFARGGRTYRYTSPHGQHADGTVKTRDEIADDVRRDPTYQLDMTTRAGLPLSLVGLASMLAFGATKVGGHVAPGSFLAGRWWPMTLAGTTAALGTLLVVEDVTSLTLDRLGQQLERSGASNKL